MLMQNLGGQTQSIMVFSELAYYNFTSLSICSWKAITKDSTGAGAKSRLPQAKEPKTMASLMGD